jgi:hypothetical protein
MPKQHGLSESPERITGLIHVDDRHITSGVVGGLRIPQRLGSRQGAI